jgi:hypothetical protein
MRDAQRAAFRATHYRFDYPDGELLLTVDAPSAILAALLRSNGVETMAVLTAFNPGGNLQAPPINVRAQQLLLDDLAAGGFSLFSGRNEDPSGEWPVEQSFLVLGITLGQARKIAARHNQLAFLWTDAKDATPRLIETAAAA